MACGRCYTHGGNSVGGVASGTYKGLDYSISLPPRQLAVLESLRDDPERLSLRREIDMLRLDLAEVRREMYEGIDAFAVDAVTSATADIQKAYRDAQVAQRAGSAEKLAQAFSDWGTGLQRLHATLDPAIAVDEGRRKAADLALKLDRLLRTENTVKLAERGMVTVDAVMMRERVLIDAYRSALDAHVSDRAVRQTILTAIARVYAAVAGRRDTPALGPGDRPDNVVDVGPAATADRRRTS